MNSLGFIILRHVNNKQTNQLWIHCYDCIRKFYPENNIVIIDDNSNYNFITNKQLYKTTIINSEFPQRGELLPYYYFSKIKFFDTAIILHDSVFINKIIDTSVDNYKFIWEFDHNWDQPDDELNMLLLFDNIDLINFYINKSLWKGCFGAMSIITFDFLQNINNKYNLSILLNSVTSRYNRCSFERVISCLLQKEYKKETLLGNIHRYCKWNISFNQIDNYHFLPVIKVWSGR
jgi:hypothetical protein